MNASELAKELSPYLMPVLPYLVKGVKIVGKEIFAGAGKKIGEDTIKNIQKIWDHLWSKVKRNPSAVQITEQIATHADDPRAENVLADQLEKLFDDDDFRVEIENLFLVAKNAGLTITSVQELGNVIGKVTGIRIASGKDLLESGATNISCSQKADVVKSGGTVVGIEIGDLKSRTEQTDNN